MSKQLTHKQGGIRLIAVDEKTEKFTMHFTIFWDTHLHGGRLNDWIRGTAISAPGRIGACYLTDSSLTINHGEIK